MQENLELEGLEVRVERRFAEIELRYHKQLDRLLAQRRQDMSALDDAMTIAKRCERDLEAVSDWQREAAEKLEAASHSSVRVDEALKVAKAASVAAEELQRGLDQSTRTVSRATEDKVASLAARIAEVSKQGAEENARRKDWERTCENTLEQHVEQISSTSTCNRNFEILEPLERRCREMESRLSDHHDDLRDLRERWMEHYVDQGETAAEIEARFVRFEGLLSGYLEELSQTLVDSRYDLRREIEDRLTGAVEQVKQCAEQHAEIRENILQEKEALFSQIEQLHLERDAMRRAWERVESLRFDENWGFFLRSDKEWKSEVLDRVREVTERLELFEGTLLRKAEEDPAVWTEIGRLGCRLADLHKLVDECTIKTKANPVVNGAHERSKLIGKPGVAAALSPAATARKLSPVVGSGSATKQHLHREALPSEQEKSPEAVRRSSRETTKRRGVRKEQSGTAPSEASMGSSVPLLRSESMRGISARAESSSRLTGSYASKDSVAPSRVHSLGSFDHRSRAYSSLCSSVTSRVDSVCSVSQTYTDSRACSRPSSCAQSRAESSEGSMDDSISASVYDESPFPEPPLHAKVSPRRPGSVRSGHVPRLSLAEEDLSSLVVDG